MRRGVNNLQYNKIHLLTFLKFETLKRYYSRVSYLKYADVSLTTVRRERCFAFSEHMLLLSIGHIRKLAQQ